MPDDLGGPPDDLGATPDPAAPSGTTGRRFLAVVGRLTAVNVLVRGLSVITAPLMARALGPEGRGEVAAIMAPLMMAAVIGMLGLGQYATRSVARGARPGTILGSVGIVLLAIGGLGALAAVPVADFLAEDRQTVETFLIIGLALLPLSLIGELLIQMTIGLERWPNMMAARLIPPATGAIGIVVLYVAGELTVASFAIVTIGGSVLQMTPGLIAMIQERDPLRVRPRVVWDGLRFGVKAWATRLTSSANARLDQLLMVRLVSSSELGLYAVGVNAASISSLFTTALVAPLGVRVARGEGDIVARAVRSTLLMSGAIAVAMAALLPLLLPLLFGSAFDGSVLMAQILLVGSVPRSAGSVLGSSLVAGGRPGASAVAQLVGLAVTVPGLLIAVPALGGEGAALVSALVGTAIFLTQVRIAGRHFRLGVREMLVPRPRDVRWGLDQLPLDRWRGRLRRAGS